MKIHLLIRCVYTLHMLNNTQIFIINICDAYVCRFFSHNVIIDDKFILFHKRGYLLIPPTYASTCTRQVSSSNSFYILY